MREVTALFETQKIPNSANSALLARNSLPPLLSAQSFGPNLAVQPIRLQSPEPDSEHNGKFDVDVAAKNFVKGFISPVTTLFSSWKSALIGAGIIAAGFALTAAVPAAAPVLVAVGIGFGVFRAATAVWKFAHAKNGDDAERAFFDTGQAAMSIGLSFLTARPALNRAGVATVGMGRGEAVVEAVKIAPAMAAKSAATIRSGQALKNLQAVANGLVSYFGTDHGAAASAAGGATPDNPLNLKQTLTLHDLDGKGLDRPVQLALAGYSAPPPGYEHATSQFTLQVVDKIGNRSVSIVTSPTASPGSIDAIGTAIAQQKNLPITYLTANEFVKYIDPAVLPPTVDTTSYLNVPKFVLPDAAIYSKATAAVSTGILVEGGRNAAVSDFVNSVSYGNKAVVVQLPGSEAWNAAKGAVGNASQYLFDQISSFLNSGTLPHPEAGGLTKLFLIENADRIGGLVRFVNGADPGAATVAANHLAPVNYGAVQGAVIFGAAQSQPQTDKGRKQ